MPTRHSLICLCIVAIALHACCEEKLSAPNAPQWENVSNEFYKSIGVYDMKSAFMRRTVGMAVAPTGDVFVLTTGPGICASKDHGKTWSVVPDNKITGRCETGFGSTIAYPYDGRVAFFTIDGTGGVTLDAGQTWRPFARIVRNFDFADIDWSTKDPQTILGLAHEPYFTVLSTNGGRAFQQIYKEAEAPNAVQKTTKQYRFGLFDADTLLRYHPDAGVIATSTDAGKTWNDGPKFKLLGRRPSHFGKNIYWTTSDGVIMSENGKDWKRIGSEMPQAFFGPFFGNSESEMMVVTEKGFFITRDGAKTWTNVAPLFLVPDGYAKKIDAFGSFMYFGWDAANNILYASQLGGSCFRLKL
ncbi:MAG: hypothetical protein WCT04_26555 [Planctomycetota bacterium]